MFQKTKSSETTEKQESKPIKVYSPKRNNLKWYWITLIPINLFMLAVLKTETPNLTILEFIVVMLIVNMLNLALGLTGSTFTPSIHTSTKIYIFPDRFELSKDWRYDWNDVVFSHEKQMNSKHPEKVQSEWVMIKSLSKKKVDTRLTPKIYTMSGEQLMSELTAFKEKYQN